MNTLDTNSLNTNSMNSLNSINTPVPVNTNSILDTTSSQFINNDTIEQINKYIDTICSNPSFLCKNRELCGNNTSIYNSIDDVNAICDNLEVANQCQNNFKECVVLVKNTFGDSDQFLASSFVNIIVPIPNALDSYGNQKFLRLPALSGSKKQGSQDVCNLCLCMNRFAQSPGAGNNSATSPGQNQCVYSNSFEYYYFPLDIEYIVSKLSNPPPITIGKYNVLVSNIIYAHSEEDLSVGTLYDLLINNSISQPNTVHFILNVLYSNDTKKANDLNLYLQGKTKEQTKTNNLNKYLKNMTFFYILLIVLISVLFI